CGPWCIPARRRPRWPPSRGRPSPRGIGCASPILCLGSANGQEAGGAGAASKWRCRAAAPGLSASRVGVRAWAGPWTRDGEGLIAGAIALVCAALVAAWPLASVTFPPMTDLPMHAAQAGALRHFFDPSYHFQDQFELHPVGTPYFSTYALGALCMLV